MGLINKTKATRLCENYINNPTRITDDANQVWFSISEMKLFLAEIERNGASGVRIYLGKYDNTDANNVDGETTIFLSPTSGNLNEDDPDMQNLDCLNFGHAGRPPKKNYPF